MKGPCSIEGCNGISMTRNLCGLHYRRWYKYGDPLKFGRVRLGTGDYKQHGLSHAPEYRAWQTMRLRCLVPTNKAYPDYGGRGIKICDRWLNSVAAFIADMGQKPSPAHEIDRENNDGHYEPSNCRWVIRKVNDRNRRSNRLLTFRGKTHPLIEWCEILEMPESTLASRMYEGWSVERALSTPPRVKGFRPSKRHSA